MASAPDPESHAVGDPQIGGLEGRVAIVTGGGQGIGRAAAHAFAACRALPVIADINAERAAAVAGEIGAAALAVETDVADPVSVEALADTVLRERERIDILFNGAAIFSTLKMRPFWDIPLDEWRRVLDVNVTGTMLATRAVVPAMREAGWGRVINVSSAAVNRGRDRYLHYIASKSAIIGMTRSMARELGGFGIAVNCILPGATLTEIPRETTTPEGFRAMAQAQCFKRTETPDDLIGCVLFLASPQTGFLTGQSLTVDGGGSHL